MKKQGRFITIEGVHGCGKSTITDMLCNRLRNQRFQVVHLVDQRGTAIGQKLRKIDLESEDFNIAPLTEGLIIAAARHQNVVEIIKPSLAEGKVVISERYNDALFAFQGFGRGPPMRLLERISTAVADGVEPDLTILLDLDPSVALDRIDPEEKHRIEKHPLDFHRKVRSGYLAQAKKHPARIKVFDASPSPDVIVENVWGEVEKVFFR